MQTKKEWAEFYATKGWKVFPCHFMASDVCSCGNPACKSPAKHPRTPRGFNDASSDLEQVRSWWASCPNANIGIATGAVSGVWVLDIDGPEGHLTLAEFEDRHGPLPATVQAITGSGNHIFFRFEDARPVGSKVKPVQGIDTRGDGGYIIAPPSNHKSGKSYEWLRSPQEIEVEQAPDWLMELICKPKRKTPRQSDYNDLFPDPNLETAEGAPEGQRHNRACVLIGSALARKIPLHRLTARAIVWGQRCNPPMDEEELLQIIESLSDKDGDKLDEMGIGDGPSWPVVRPEAFHGLAGDVVRTVEPESEADPMSLLIQFLVVFGNSIGRSAHYVVEATRHYGNLFSVIVGATSSARKGTSFDRVRDLFRGLPDCFSPLRIISGLSSGEGLIWAVRDAGIKSSSAAKTISNPVDVQGVTDKRLTVIESEFASVLSVVKREGNTLSPVVREAWQTGNLDTLVKNSPARATNAHISIIGHITLHELRTCWPSVEGFNGFANRFLWVNAQRSKILPDGGRPLDLKPLQERIAASIDFANRVEQVMRDEEASKLWHDRYATLGTNRVGVVAGVIARAQPQVVRLSMLFAVLDLSATIRREHLVAAFAVWDYCEDSAAYIFGDSQGNKHADRILAALRKQSLPTRELHRLFNNRLTAADLKACLELLLSQRLIRRETQPTGGRPSHIWHIM